MNSSEFTERFQGLTPKPRNVLELLLNGKSDDEIAQLIGASASTVRKHIQNLCDRFEIPREAEGLKRNRREDLIALARQYKPQLRQASPPSAQTAIATSSQDWGDAPDDSVFYGRTQELATLEQWIIRDRCRLVAISGIGGIGKTLLCVKLSKQIQNHFSVAIWHSFRQGLVLDDFLDRFLNLFPQKARLPSDKNEKLKQCLQHLQDHRCLLIFDQLDAIFGEKEFAGSYLEGYQDYEEFIKKVAEVNHQSCLLINSVEIPSQIALLENQDGFVRQYKLKGLAVEDAQNILIEKNLTGKERWADIINFFEGNPLVIKMIAATIKELYNGDVIPFLRHSYTQLGRDLEIFLKDVLDRLQPLESDLIYQMAIAVEPLSFDTLQTLIFPPPSLSELQRAIESLSRRSLIEIRGGKFILPQAIVAYGNMQLVEEVFQEIQALLANKNINSLKRLRVHNLIQPEKASPKPQSLNRVSLKESIRKRLDLTFFNQSWVKALQSLLPLFQDQPQLTVGYSERNLQYLISEFDRRMIN
ncbi:MAG: NB-ARC domain-containing protein [Desertifilum sp.]|nr:NB-ARC domain-containing protein [Desertifilum sp.]